MKALHMLAFILTVVGAVNWGLIGLIGFNLVNFLLLTMPDVERFVYVLVGVSAVYLTVTHMKDCKVCSGK